MTGLRSIGAVGHAGALFPEIDRPTKIDRVALEGGRFEKVLET